MCSYIGKILENIPATVDKMNRLFDIQDEPIKAGMDDLKARGMIEILSSIMKCKWVNR